ncbi:MAG TPA: arsenate reductase (glutaredoxin) [Saprospiraceae bacterium]|nr:arsenate reductase (glutaredoxin) [Saprospiraceae bacterium]
MKIYHNPRCSKSRQTLAILQENGVEPEIILYLTDTPSREELQSLLKKLDMKAEQIIRKGEAIYKEKYKGKNLTEEEWIDAMVEHPKLIERPIVVNGDAAVLGRPPENVKILM